MPIVDENRLKGNYGAAVVMAWLAGECLVRPVAVDTDVGVDLYCETVAESQPFLHFWLQVKAGGQCARNGIGDKASCRFSLDQLRYWSRQPVPVFAALVPTDWPAHGEPDVYVVDLTTQILFSGLPPSDASATLWSDCHWQAGNRGAIQAFLTEMVPATTARLQVSKGFVTDTPEPKPQYVHTRPLVPVLRFKKEILYQLRTTAAHSVLFALACNKLSDEDREFYRLLAHIVEQFGEDPHWENFMARASASHADGEFGDALAMYVKARTCIQNDERVRDEPIWQERVRFIEEQEQRANNGMQPATGT